ncbi:hypothetical protein OPV22_007207 [Ensete ventricosum]|uniref:Uncharacterized protein n=1 Tax=Ensete ventricosum TaxID=4639 RepID=A0AAV8Q7X9_ENSVE|nr:hypothetical protein OPV22_007207 [Ensete ventricosum]
MEETGSDAGFDDGWRRRGLRARASCMRPKPPPTWLADSQQKARSTPSPEPSSAVLISGLDIWDSNEYSKKKKKKRLRTGNAESVVIFLGTADEHMGLALITEMLRANPYA